MQYRTILGLALSALGSVALAGGGQDPKYPFPKPGPYGDLVQCSSRARSEDVHAVYSGQHGTGRLTFLRLDIGKTHFDMSVVNPIFSGTQSYFDPKAEAAYADAYESYHSANLRFPAGAKTGTLKVYRHGKESEAKTYVVECAFYPPKR